MCGSGGLGESDQETIISDRGDKEGRQGRKQQKALEKKKKKRNEADRNDRWEMEEEAIVEDDGRTRRG